MTYEKEIPAYALQVAKVPQITPCQAVYHTETLMSTGARQCITYQFEEDILVPDTKEDMEEILKKNQQIHAEAASAMEALCSFLRFANPEVATPGDCAATIRQYDALIKEYTSL